MTTIELFKKLLKFKSITPNDAGTFEFIDEYLGDEWECIVSDYKDVKNRFYYKKFNNTDQHLCFGGHIDVVPPGDGWDTDPFEPVEKDGQIFARGTQDMKSGVAAFLYACKHTEHFDGTLSILLTSDEEGDGIHGTVIALEDLKKRNFLPDYAVVAEPTCEKVFGDTIKIGRRGSINGYLTLNGVQGHAAYPERAINPIHLISTILPNMASHYFDNGDEFFSPSVLTLTDLRAGFQVTNLTPDKLNLMFNVRNSTKTNQQSIQDFIDSEFKNLDYTFRMTQSSYPFITSESSKMVQKINDSIYNTVKIKPHYSTAGGTSDARFFSQYGSDTIEFGVINDKIHSKNERTSISEVENLTKVFSNLIENF